MADAELEVSCPGCGRRNPLHECATTPGSRPSAGDVTVCWACAAPAVFERTPVGVLTLRAPSAEEELQLQRDPEIAAVLAARAASSDPVSAAADAHRRLGGHL